MGLLAKQATISVTDFGPQSAAPDAESPVAICALVRNVRNNWTRDEIDQTALCDNDKVFLPSYSDEEISMEVYVPSAGFVFRGLRDHWVRVVIDPDGVGSIGTITVDGWLSRYDYNMDVGGSQIEQITLKKRGTAFT